MRLLTKLAYCTFGVEGVEVSAVEEALEEGASELEEALEEGALDVAA